MKLKSSQISAMAAEGVSIALTKLYSYRSMDVPIKLKAFISVDLKSTAGSTGPIGTFGKWPTTLEVRCPINPNRLLCSTLRATNRVKG